MQYPIFSFCIMAQWKVLRLSRYISFEVDSSAWLVHIRTNLECIGTTLEHKCWLGRTSGSSFQPLPTSDRSDNSTLRCTDSSPSSADPSCNRLLWSHIGPADFVRRRFGRVGPCVPTNIPSPGSSSDCWCTHWRWTRHILNLNNRRLTPDQRTWN